MQFIAKAIRISHAKFHCNRLPTVQIFKITGVSFFWHIMYIVFAYKILQAKIPMHPSLTGASNVGGVWKNCDFQWRRRRRQRVEDDDDDDDSDNVTWTGLPAVLFQLLPTSALFVVCNLCVIVPVNLLVWVTDINHWSCRRMMCLRWCISSWQSTAGCTLNSTHTDTPTWKSYYQSGYG